MSRVFIIISHVVTALSVFAASDGHEAFEGLRAEECGILNGCENGRCVRVQEGYTCDCFDGFTLDLARMACVGTTAPPVGNIRRGVFVSMKED